jgi:hypothetical protein
MQSRLNIRRKSTKILEMQAVQRTLIDLSKHCCGISDRTARFLTTLLAEEQPNIEPLLHPYRFVSNDSVG